MIGIFQEFDHYITNNLFSRTSSVAFFVTNFKVQKPLVIGALQK